MGFQPDRERHVPKMDLGDAIEQAEVPLASLPTGSVLKVRSTVLTYTLGIFPDGVKIWNFLGDYGGFRGNFSDIGNGLAGYKKGVLKIGEPTRFPYFEYDSDNNALPDDDGWIDTVLKIKVRKPEEQ